MAGDINAAPGPLQARSDPPLENGMSYLTNVLAGGCITCTTASHTKYTTSGIAKIHL